MKYYSLKNILKLNAQYNIIIGERSNGKTYAALLYGLTEYCKNGAEMAYIRRWREDIRGFRGENLFKSIYSGEVNHVSKLTAGEWTRIYYYAGKWYLARTVEKDGKETVEHAAEPFCYSFALTEMEHDKGNSTPNIKTVVFDEFLTRTAYLPDEFILFMNVLSTIIRLRDDVKIFMLGNTVNQYSPYFKEMGLNGIEKMKQGDIQLYTYGNTPLKVAVEFSDSPAKFKPSNVYFAFDNPKLNMIRGSEDTAVWEMNIYPHCPKKYTGKDILFTYFIIFENSILQCEIINADGDMFTFIHEKSTPLKNPDSDLIYSLDFDPRPNYRRRIDRPILPIEKTVYSFFVADKVFYQSNEVGEKVRNYLKAMRSNVLQ